MEIFQCPLTVPTFSMPFDRPHLFNALWSSPPFQRPLIVPTFSTPFDHPPDIISDALILQKAWVRGINDSLSISRWYLFEISNTIVENSYGSSNRPTPTSVIGRVICRASSTGSTARRKSSPAAREVTFKGWVCEKRNPPKLTLLAQGLITTKQTKPRSVASAAPHPIVNICNNFDFMNKLTRENCTRLNSNNSYTKLLINSKKKLDQNDRILRQRGGGQQLTRGAGGESSNVSFASRRSIY